MKRRNFLKDITLAIAASLLPKILQPCSFETAEELLIGQTEEYSFEGLIPYVMNPKNHLYINYPFEAGSLALKDFDYLLKRKK